MSSRHSRHWWFVLVVYITGYLQDLLLTRLLYSDVFSRPVCHQGTAAVCGLWLIVYKGYLQDLLYDTRASFCCQRTVYTHSCAAAVHTCMHAHASIGCPSGVYCACLHLYMPHTLGVGTAIISATNGKQISKPSNKSALLVMSSVAWVAQACARACCGCGRYGSSVSSLLSEESFASCR